MRLRSLRLLVASSLLAASLAGAATRPHYGGTLRVVMRGGAGSLDPADTTQGDSLTNWNLSRLMFDTLVFVDDRGNPQPGLATSWQADPGNLRWRLNLRRGVTFQGGSPMSPYTVAASLRAANPSWRVFPADDAVVIELDSPSPDLPAELALARNSIVLRDGKGLGTGPFFATQSVPGKKLVLAARDDYWQGRAYVDSIEIDLGAGFREQMISLDLGKADVVEIAPDQARRATGGGRHTESSAPMELVALVFARDPQSAEESRQREALALSIDRGLLNTVLLQGGGEPAGSLLPNWMTGYAFLFPSDSDPAKARQSAKDVGQAISWTLSYDTSDSLARVIAERIVLNARDSGLSLQLKPGSTADARLVRLPLASLAPNVALKRLAAGLGLSQPKFANQSAESLYWTEKALLQSQRVIPLLHLRFAFGRNAAVKNWTLERDGSWRLDAVWLGAEKP